jgi:hypothetical protein
VSDPRTNWKNELRATGDCIAIERLGEELTRKEREHLQSCARCQAEMKLWEEFRDDEARAGEDEDVQWITGKLRAAATTSNVIQISSWKKAFHPRSLAIAASLVLAIAIGYVVQNREPSVDVSLTTGPSAYRSARVALITPKGDLDTAPRELRWQAISGAESYDVQVVEVDRTILWRVSARGPRVELPPAVIEQCVPGKTILWQVSARRNGTVLAESGLQRFRVKAR